MRSIYSAGLGFLTTAFVILFQIFAYHLRLDVAVAPKIESCKSLFNIESCNFLSYILVMYMESLQVFCGLICSLTTIIILGNVLKNFKLAKFQMVLVFAFSYVTFYFVFTDFDFIMFIYFSITSAIYSISLLLLVKVLINLTSCSRGKNYSWLFSLRSTF